MKNRLFIDAPDYIKICEALDKGKKMIPVPGGNMDELTSICTFALQNTPTAIGVNGFQFMMIPGVVNIMPRYTFERGKASDLVKKCKERRTKIIGRCKRDNPYDSAVAVHDMLARNIEYKDDGNLAHSMAAPLTLKYGVCDGFSKAYKFVMDGLNIPCIVVSGEAQDPMTMKLEPHAWNMIQIDGRWCHVDVTFDTGIKSGDCPRYDYFGLSDDNVLIDHSYDRTNYPAAIGDALDYYSTHGNFMLNKHRLMEYFEKHIDDLDIVVKVGDNVPEKNLTDSITAAFNEVLKRHGKSIGYSYSYNLKQKVVQISIR